MKTIEKNPKKRRPNKRRPKRIPRKGEQRK
jgi:hypothetical protein